MTNYYKILGVRDFASTDEIKVGYRKLSKKFHPDVNDGDEFFSEKFKEIQEAYEQLTDDFKKSKYDELLRSYLGKINGNNEESKSNAQTEIKYSPSITIIKNENTKGNAKKNKNAILITCVILIAVFCLIYYNLMLKIQAGNTSAPMVNDGTTNRSVEIKERASKNDSRESELELQSSKNENSERYFTIGASEEEVLQIQGNPSSIMSVGLEVFWHYGSSSVTFEKGKVSEFSNIGNNLKIKLTNEQSSAQNGHTYFTIGSTKNEVLKIQGNPSTTMKVGLEEFWHYGSSSLTFESGKISEYSNIGDNLKIKLIDEQSAPPTALAYFTIGSTEKEVLQIQGNPSAIMNIGSETFWHYGSSSLTFENGKVSEYNNIGNNLKIKLID